MNILLITQDDPFYIPDSIEYLLKILPPEHKIISSIVLSPSPYGKRESLIKKSLKILSIFGIRFFLYYTVKYIIGKSIKRKNLFKLLNDYKIDRLTLNNSINSVDSIQKIKTVNADILISIMGNEIFSEELTKVTEFGCLNLHCSLLPKYRGLMPSFWVLKNNEKYTGVSVFKVDNGIDSGPIFSQKRIKIKYNTTHRELIRSTKKLGMEAIVDALQNINNKEFIPFLNDERNKSYYTFPVRNDVKIFLKNKKKFF